MRKAAIGAMVLAWSAYVAQAHADAVHVSTTEHGSWRESIVALQRDVASGGTTLHVQVRDVFGGQLGCGRYSLEPDPVTAAVFEIGTCDATTGTTPLRVRNRDALFIPDDPVPRLQTAGLTVVEIQRSTVEGGGESAGSIEVNCTASVRPYLDDLQRGTRVYLSPGRYALRSVSSSVQSTWDGTGWTLRSDAALASVSIEYEVFDTARSQVVLRDRTTLTCAHHAVGAMDVAGGNTVPLIPATPVSNHRGASLGSGLLFTLAIGPSVLGAVDLAVGIASADLRPTFVTIGAVASVAAVGLIIDGVVTSVREHRARDAAERLQLASLGVNPVEHGSGAMVWATLRF